MIAPSLAQPKGTAGKKNVVEFLANGAAVGASLVI
jgi:hypothetical protein